MAKITKEVTLVLTAAEADAFIRNADGKVLFQFKVTAFLPVTEDTGFEGMTFMSVGKRQARILVAGFTQHLSERGAKVTLRCSPPRYEGSTAFVSIY